MTPMKKLTLAVAGILCVVGLIRALTAPANADRSETSAAKDAASTLGFAGSASCSARACHGRDRPVDDNTAVSLQNEFTFGLLHDKHTQAYSVLLQPRAQLIAQNLARRTTKDYIPAHEDARCLACHATPQSAWAQAQAQNAGQKQKPDLATANWQLGGVSCEACHGPANGEKPWLEIHTARSQWRDKLKPAEKEAYGFMDLSNYARQAEVCAGCHVGAPANEKLKMPVRDCNHDIMASGHPRLNFELSVFRANMPPHWKPKQEDNADIWMKGRIVSAHNALDLLIHRVQEAEKSKENARWPEFAEYRCFACHKDLNTDWRGATNDPRRPKGSFPYDSWYSTMLPELNPKLSDGYDKLTTAMAKPLPDYKTVRELATALKKELEQSLKTPTPKDLLETILEKNKSLPGVWEDAMQLTLALAALKREELLKSPEAVPSLRQLSEALSFPPKSEGPSGFDFPDRIKKAQKAFLDFHNMK